MAHGSALGHKHMQRSGGIPRAVERRPARLCHVQHPVDDQRVERREPRVGEDSGQRRAIPAGDNVVDRSWK